jgi:PAS domain S-box-containing protein
MLVRDYMTPSPKTLRINDTLKDAAQLFYRYRINGAPILGDDGTLSGLITVADFIRAVIGGIAFSQPVESIMTRNVITVTPETSLEEAYRIPVRYLPVVSEENRVVGILTKSDFLEAFRAQADRTVSEIQGFIRSAHNGIVVVNAYGIITTFNGAAARLTGVPAAKAPGLPIDEVIPDSGLRRVLATGKSETGCHLTINGLTVFSNRSPIFEGPKVVGALAIIQDTSELAKVADQLSSIQHRVEALENIFESARQGIIVVDESGTVTMVNKAFEDIFNVSREDLVGRPVTETVENTRMHIVAQSGVPEFGDIQNYKGRQVIVNRVPMFKDGCCIGAIGEAMFKDITEVNELLARLDPREEPPVRPAGTVTRPAKDTGKADYSFANIIGSSRAMIKAKNLAAKSARYDSNVLITGESGTGKELFARAIHSASRRRGQPFVTINCAAIPFELLESELFGYEEGSFTGAKKGGKKGKFELADKGTLFLDEIGDMPLSMQAKILRVLQDKSLDHIGGSQPLACDVRIIAATNRNLPQMVQEQRFREDLFYRLNVLSLEIPPLREREEDVGELVANLLPTICARLGVAAKELSPEAMELLRRHRWPGNVRELINLLEQVAATVDSPLVTAKHLMRSNFSLRLRAGAPGGTATEDGAERERIVAALKYTGNNKLLAAKLLGWHRSTLYEKLKKYNL